MKWYSAGSQAMNLFVFAALALIAISTLADNDTGTENNAMHKEFDSGTSGAGEKFEI